MKYGNYTARCVLHLYYGKSFSENCQWPIGISTYTFYTLFENNLNEFTSNYTDGLVLPLLAHNPQI